MTAPRGTRHLTISTGARRVLLTAVLMTMASATPRAVANGLSNGRAGTGRSLEAVHQPGRLDVGLTGSVGAAGLLVVAVAAGRPRRRRERAIRRFRAELQGVAPTGGPRFRVMRRAKHSPSP